MADCLFCKMVAGQIPAQKVYEDPDCIGVRDINPQAPTHVLFIPKRHIATLNDATRDERDLLGSLLLAVSTHAKAEGIAEPGYRVVINCNRDGQQTVFHLHVHMLAGRAMTWPPG